MKKYNFPILFSFQLPSFTIFMCFVFCTPGYGQKIYSWTDANGVTHFSDTPPASAVHDRFAVKEQAQSKKHFGRHRLYNIRKGYDYCGNRRLPSQKESGPKLKLINIMSARKSTTLYKEKLEKDLQLAKKQQKKAGNSKRASGRIQTINHKIDECDCMLSWMDNELQSLEHLKDQIIMEARQAEVSFDEIENKCGPKPAPGTYTQAEIIQWAECDKNNLKKRNKLLKEKKAAKHLEEALIQNMD